MSIRVPPQALGTNSSHWVVNYLTILLYPIPCFNLCRNKSNMFFKVNVSIVGLKPLLTSPPPQVIYCWQSQGGSSGLVLW